MSGAEVDDQALAGLHYADSNSQPTPANLRPDLEAKTLTVELHRMGVLLALSLLSFILT